MKRIIIISIILIILIFFVFRFFVLNDELNDEVIETSNLKDYNIEDYIDISYFADISSYYVYGTHFNIEGTLNNVHDIFNECGIQSISDVYFEMCLKNLTDEIKYNLDYEIDEENGSVKFKLSENINDGIYLDDISTGEYLLLLKLNYKVKNSELNNDETYCRYISFNVNDSYDDIEYYTITKDDTNNKIVIKQESNNNKNLIKFIVSEDSISDEEIYDITLDAGHGGIDSGAVKDDYYESDIVLEYVKLLKSELEEMGLKVKLTRDSDVYVAPYGNDGRAVIPNLVKSKYCFSLHLNSNEITLYNGGFEVYCPSNIDYGFARTLVNNILENTNIDTSVNYSNKVEEGIYVNNFTSAQIKEADDYAEEMGYEKYTITTDTPYLFMLRETGGIATNAYVDGRNTEYDENPYYNSNQACEAYLLELGYINVSSDLKNILNQKEEYVKAIANSIQSLVNNEID